jgi:hypothetical protein
MIFWMIPVRIKNQGGLCIERITLTIGTFPSNGKMVMLARRFITWHATRKQVVYVVGQPVIARMGLPMHPLFWPKVVNTTRPPIDICLTVGTLAREYLE